MRRGDIDPDAMVRATDAWSLAVSVRAFQMAWKAYQEEGANRETINGVLVWTDLLRMAQEATGLELVLYASLRDISAIAERERVVAESVAV